MPPTSLVRTLAALLVLPLAGCDLFPSVPATAPDDEPLSDLRFGIVHWEAVATDCPDGAWDVDEVGMALVEGDTLTLWFETVPELTGTLAPDRGAGRGTSIDGAMTFPGDTGATVSCVVDGTATVSDAEVAGEMTERLSSDGDVNCVSRGRYTFVFDDY